LLSTSFQIKLLKILALLGEGDKAASDSMYSVLGSVLKRADTSSNIGNAILYECIRTITSIHPHERLIGDVADITSRFLKVQFTLLLRSPHMISDFLASIVLAFS
jgi:AP-4 complex subunit epsilon-1